MISNYAPAYSTSHALIIGINKYKYVSPLSYARNDAEAIRNVLVQLFGFKLEHVTALYDDDATYGAIRSAFLSYANAGTDYDDRLLVFFAGHGHTITGRKGEIGYLVPSDGRTDDLSTLLRWDDLTKNGDLINAKHILYIMDACYGGLALTRSIAPGTKRFLKDMLTRHSRQVIAAGKANEVVSDGGGPRLGHSMFTGHLLDALEADVLRTEGGAVTANRAMAYVYHKVSGDPDSNQTPHYGFIDGDGDFIFDLKILSELEETNGGERDVLVTMSPFPGTPENDDGPSSLELVKEYLTEPRYRIKLDDLFSQELRTAIANVAAVHADSFRDYPSAELFVKRIQAYEKAIAPLQRICTLLARWGATNDHKELLRRIITQFSPTDVPSGYDLWSDLRWYPTMLVLFSSGVGAVAQSNYQMLSGLFSTYVVDPWSGGTKPLLEQMLDRWRKVLSSKFFTTIPGHEKHFVPDREYMFKFLQPSVEDLLFLGVDYEAAFDRFEALLALSYLDQSLERDEGSGFALPGRYAYKQGRSGDPYAAVLADAVKQESQGILTPYGVFSSLARFKDVHARHKTFIDSLHW